MSESSMESSNSYSEYVDSGSDENNKSIMINSKSNQASTKSDKHSESNTTEDSSESQNKFIEKRQNSSNDESSSNNKENSDEDNSSNEDNNKCLKKDSQTVNHKNEEKVKSETKKAKNEKEKKTKEDKEKKEREIKSDSSEEKPKIKESKEKNVNAQSQKANIKRASSLSLLDEKKSDNSDKKGRKSSERKEKDRKESAEYKAKSKNAKNTNVDKKQKATDLDQIEKTNVEEIPKMTFDQKKDDNENNSNSPPKKRKSVVTFEFPEIQNEDSKDEIRFQLKKRSKSDDFLDKDATNINISESMGKNSNRTRCLSLAAGKISIDPRNIPRRFSKMTIEQIDKVIETEDRLLDAITYFNQNKDPSKLCEYYEVEETPSNIAQIFWSIKDINSNVLGTYLLKTKDMLDAYFMEVEMDKGPIQSLRNALLGPMRFDGESQTVHKVLSAISRCYAKKNPDKCDDSDNVLDLYYALIMLNTDLSNPNNKTKMTLQQFIKNTKGANQYLSTLDDDELTGYYQNIQKNPLLFQNQSDDFIYDICPKIRGYLKKKSIHTFSTWTRKYFVLVNSCLYYFSDDNPENAKSPLGAVYLKGVEPVRDRDTAPLLIRIIAKKKEVKYAKFTNGQKESPKYLKGIKEIILEAPDRASSSKWFHRIRVAAQMSNFLKAKKIESSSEKNVYEADVPDAADDSVEECDQ